MDTTAHFGDAYRTLEVRVVRDNKGLPVPMLVTLRPTLANRIRT